MKVRMLRGSGVFAIWKVDAADPQRPQAAGEALCHSHHGRLLFEEMDSSRVLRRTVSICDSVYSDEPGGGAPLPLTHGDVNTVPFAIRHTSMSCKGHRLNAIPRPDLHMD